MTHQFFKVATLTTLLSLTVFSATSFAEQDQKMQNKNGKGKPNFAALDTNSDGVISYDEFASKPIPHGDHEKVFNEIDADGDGEISEDEFNSHKPPRPQREDRQ